MKKESETKTIEEWLRTVDKPLATKVGDKRTRKQKARNRPGRPSGNHSARAIWWFNQHLLEQKQAIYRIINREFGTKGDFGAGEDWLKNLSTHEPEILYNNTYILKLFVCAVD